MSDFPEFDKAYKTVLMKDQNDRFERLAAEANFNVYHSDIWRGTGRKFAELIVRECAKVVDDIADPEDSERYFWAIQNASEKIKEHFGLEPKYHEYHQEDYDPNFGDKNENI